MRAHDERTETRATDTSASFTRTDSVESWKGFQKRIQGAGGGGGILKLV